jgi:hypothetical protein
VKNLACHKVQHGPRNVFDCRLINQYTIYLILWTGSTEQLVSTTKTTESPTKDELRMESSVPGSLIKRSGRSDEAAAAAIKKPHTTVHNHNPTDEIKTDCKHGIAIYSTRATPEAGVPDQILPTKWKPDNDNIQLTSNIETENSTAEGTNLLPADLTRSKTALSSPVDPGYARILSSTALDTNSRVSDEDVESILGDWDRKYRRKNSGRIRNLHDPQDSDHEDVLSPGPATAPENVIYNRKPSDSNPDDEYRRIFRRHNFDFNDPAPVKESLCHVCGRWKPVIQHRKYRQICNGCRLAFSTKQPFHTTCGSCFAAKPVHDVEVINGHSRCSDCRAAGFHKRTNRAFSDQHADQRDDVHGDGIVLTPREERQRRPSRPPGFVDSKSILKDLRKPVNARRAAPKRKLVQEEDVALYDAIAQRDMIMRKRRTMMESADTESSSISGYSEAPMKSNSQLIRLGIRTASNGPPIWIKVSRSAPLEKMFMAALQSDDALRGYVFMLPGRYVHMDDTPNEVRSIRGPERGPANCICSSVLQMMIASRCISFLESGYQTPDP